MNRDMILAAAVAAGLHAGVFGFRSTQAGPDHTQPASDPEPWILQIVPEGPPEPPVEPQNIDEPLPPLAVITCSVGAELPAIDSFAEFQIIRPPSPEIRIPNVDRIDPNGISNGTKTSSADWVLKTQLDNVPRALFRTAPSRPPGSGEDRETVSVDFMVGKDGNVSSARVIESTNSLLNDACVGAVKRWRFEPGVRKNVPVSFRMQQTFVFTTRD